MTFVTKDSGERATFASGMQRDSGAKTLRPDLLPGPMVIRWAELMGRGAEKYGERNWEKANSPEELARFKASAFRHFLQWFYGLDTEEDHAASVFFNIGGAEFVAAKLRAMPARPVILNDDEELRTASDGTVYVVNVRALEGAARDYETDPFAESGAR